jgi:Domain of unknown function (DUF4845)
MSIRHRAPAASPCLPTGAARGAQRGVTLFGLLFWGVIIAVAALVIMKVVPTVNEFSTIQSAVDKVAREGGSTVPEIRAAFDRQKEIEYSIKSISGADLEITKVNDQVVISYAYDAEIELMDPVYLVIKYQGKSK